MKTSLIEQLAATPAVGQDYRPYALAPGGGAVAFEWYEGGDWQIYLKDLPDGEPRRVGRLDDRCGCPQFSPDGRYLYFTCDDRGSECYDVYRYDLSAGELVNLLSDTPDLAPLPDPDLSPDGARLAHDRGARRRLRGRGDAGAAEPRRRALRYLTEHPYTESSPRWSPGRDAARRDHRDARPGHRRSWSSTWSPARPASSAGRTSSTPVSAAWSPEGGRIAFSGGPGDRPAIGIYELATGSVTWAWEDHHVDAHHPVWAPDGAALAFLVDVEGETGLLHVDLRDGAVTEYSIGPGNHYAPGVHARRGRADVRPQPPRRPARPVPRRARTTAT